MFILDGISAQKWSTQSINYFLRLKLLVIRQKYILMFILGQTARNCRVSKSCQSNGKQMSCPKLIRCLLLPMLWGDGKLGHFGTNQKYFFLQNDLPYSVDVEPTLNKNHFDHIIGIKCMPWIMPIWVYYGLYGKDMGFICSLGRCKISFYYPSSNE